MSETADKSLADYEVLLCVTGGVACYKVASLASALVQRGAGVHVAMTPAAERFVAPLTFQALTRRQVFTSMWQSAEDWNSQHISLTEQVDLMIVAPATANIIGKMACGIADDLVSTMHIASSGACEVLIAPAMNSRMWSAPAVQANVKTLKSRGIHLIGPNEGNLACGAVGPGRMSEPDEILAEASRLLLADAPKNSGA